MRERKRRRKHEKEDWVSDRQEGLAKQRPFLSVSFYILFVGSNVRVYKGRNCVGNSRETAALESPYLRSPDPDSHAARDQGMCILEGKERV